MHVVSGRLAVTEHLRPPTGVQMMGKDGYDSCLPVRALPRPVNVPESADRMGDAGGRGPRLDVCLSGPLGCSVGRERRGNPIFGGRYRRLVSVQRTTGGG